MGAAGDHAERAGCGGVGPTGHDPLDELPERLNPLVVLDTISQDCLVHVLVGDVG